MSTLFTDSMTYSNGALSTVASSVYSTLTSETSLQVSTNHLVPNAFNQDSANYVNATQIPTMPNDQGAKIKITPPTNSGSDGSGVGVMLRGAAAARSDYRCAAGASVAHISKFTAGTWSGVLASQAGLTIVAGDELDGSIQGTSIVLKINGVTQVTLTDASLASGRAGPMHSSDTSGTPQLDDLTIYDFAGAATSLVMPHNPLAAMVGR